MPCGYERCVPPPLGREGYAGSISGVVQSPPGPLPVIDRIGRVPARMAIVLQILPADAMLRADPPDPFNQFDEHHHVQFARCCGRLVERLALFPVDFRNLPRRAQVGGDRRPDFLMRRRHFKQEPVKTRQLASRLEAPCCKVDGTE